MIMTTRVFCYAQSSNSDHPRICCIKHRSKKARPREAIQPRALRASIDPLYIAACSPHSHHTLHMQPQWNPHMVQIQTHIIRFYIEKPCHGGARQASDPGTALFRAS